ncbi:MAG: DUF4384 domain-containing protein, partial [Bacteroidota bacterium]|nr:DUF4384 domain-containing protein [Bacteroidota bacterium]MDX5431481.1 DUF4384 domain-containing protein [Bacteroidota bacterium]MDX5470205.1 DUF4384 domain-containing protein [Bacteroidota bacterium]
TGEGRFKKTKTEEKARGNIEDYTIDGMVSLDSGTMFKIKITNVGNELAYFTILDIAVDNQVVVLVPKRNESAEEYKIRPGESIELDRIYTANPPSGVEMIKLISASTPMDLRQMVLQRGDGARSLNPFEKLVQRSYPGRTRGITDDEEDIEVPASNTHVYTYIFKIN